MNERGWLQSMPMPLIAELPRRDSPEFAVNLPEEIVFRKLVTLGCAVQESSNFGCRHGLLF